MPGGKESNSAGVEGAEVELFHYTADVLALVKEAESFGKLKLLGRYIERGEEFTVIIPIVSNA